MEDVASSRNLPYKVTIVAAGKAHTLVLTGDERIYSWGRGTLGRLGLGLEQDQLFPTEIKFGSQNSVRIVEIVAGAYHSLALAALISVGESYNGEQDDLVCYSWGNNNHGQLGLGEENRPNPEMVKTFDRNSHWSIYEITCGAFHTALLTRRKKRLNDALELESVCWKFGLGDNGQLGHGTIQSTTIPEPVQELPQFVNLVSVDCGLFHTCVVSSDWDVWSWGMEKGLGLYPDARVVGEYSSDALSPLAIRNPCEDRFLEPVQVACGAAHTVIVAQEGYKVWYLGRGRSGVLGNCKVMDCYTSTLVLWPPLVEYFNFKQEEEQSSLREQEKGKKKTEG
ncbi:hypothetical protein RYX36_022077 [Vicia faba]